MVGVAEIASDFLGSVVVVRVEVDHGGVVLS
jgi:hypothetical protein